MRDLSTSLHPAPCGITVRYDVTGYGLKAFHQYGKYDMRRTGECDRGEGEGTRGA